MKKTIIGALALAAVAACSMEPLPYLFSLAKLSASAAPFSDIAERSAAHGLFESGLELYEEGDYAGAAKSLHAALNLGLARDERVVAHKHLAFIYCISDLEPACRSEFRKALAAQPGMDLEPEEAGHPKWGPVFKDVRSTLLPTAQR